MHPIPTPTLQLGRVPAHDGIALRLREWITPRSSATVVLVHGFAEHAGRYAEFAATLNRHACSVIAVDLRGHGESAGPRGHVVAFDDYLLDVDVAVARARARRERVALFGHSMGGLIVCSWLLERHHADLIGVVLSSPFLGLARPLARPARWIIDLAARIAPSLSVAASVRGRDLTRDLEKAAEYDADPLVFRRARLGWVRATLGAIDRVHATASAFDAPMLVLFAGDDHIVDADRTASFVAQLRVADISSDGVTGLGHEILNAPPAERARVSQTIVAWLRARVTASG